MPQASHELPPRPASPLFLDAGSPERMRKAIDRDRFAAGVAEAILQEARRIDGSAPLSLTREPGRAVILPTARDLFHRVTHLGVAAMLSGDNRLRRRGVCEITNAATFDDWNPRHFLDTAEMATAVAIGLDWFSPVMSAQERRLVTEALATKSLTPALAAFDANAFWLGATTNWNVVCCGGTIVAAVAMLGHQPDLARAVLSRAIPALANGLSAFDVEGGYTEGPGYWEYAVKYAALVLAALEQAGMDAPDAPGLGRTWRYGRATTAPSGDCFDYGDTLLRPGRSPVLGWLARRSGEAGAATWQRAAPGRPHPLDLVWLSDAAAETEPHEACAVFPHTGIAVLRGHGDGSYLGLKGGRNDVNHAHLDLGSFVLEWDGIRFISELGRDDYALPGYFDPATRFGYFRLGTSGHGTLQFAGRNQSTAAHGEITGVADRPTFSATAMRIRNPASAVDWQRGAAIAGGAIWVVDELAAAAPAPVTWQAFTRAEVRLSGATATLSLGGRAIVAEIVAPRGAIWHAAPTASPVGEASNAGVTTLSFSVPLENGESRCAVAFSQGGLAGRDDAPGSLAEWGLQPVRRSRDQEHPR